MSQASLFETEPAEVADAREQVGRAQARRAQAVRGSGRVLVVEADGGSRGNPGPAGYGALVREGDVVRAERGEFLGVCSNNVAEYSGLIAGLRAAAEIDPTARVEVRMDSKLVVEQMSGNWKIKHADMRRLALEARDILPVGQVSYTWIPRAENGAADAIANAVMDSGGQITNDYDDAPPAASGGTGPVADGDDSRAASDGAAAAGDGAGTAGDDASAGPSSGPDGDARDESGDDAVLGEDAPVPDVDTNAPSLSDPDAITLVLVSPGVAPRDRDGDPELTDQGLELAAAAAAVVDTIGDSLWPHLTRPTMLLASPLVRALQTAELISEVADLGVPTVDDDFAPAAPDESPTELGDRVERALARLDATCGGCTIVVAAHADVIAAIIGTVVAAPTDAWGVFRIAPGTVSVVRRWSGRGEVHVIGCPAQLGDD